MSGGHYDYAYGHVEYFIDKLVVEAPPPEAGWGDDAIDPYVDYALRQKFKEHLVKIAQAMRAIEWNDSGDGAPKERELIEDCLRGSP